MINQLDSLDSLVAIVPVLKAAIPADLSIANCDMKQFIAFFPGKIGQEQAASTQQISTFIEEIQDMSNKLNEYTKKL